MAVHSVLQVFLVLCIFHQGASKAPYDGCGRTKDCLFSPKNCDKTADCDRFLAYYYKDGEAVVNFELAVKAPKNGGSFYAAVGFSFDNEMTNDAVTACVYVNSKTKMVLGFNPKVFSPTAMLPENYTSSVIASDSGSLVDGTLQCAFAQKIHPEVAAAEKRIFPLDANYYLQLASGAYNETSESILIHSAKPVVTEASVFLLSPPGSVKLISKLGCGYLKGCFMTPAGCDPGYNCDKAVSYAIANGSDSVGFEISVKRPNNESSDFYAAVGFSPSGKMGNASVTACTFSGSHTDVTLWHNPPGYAPPERVAIPQNDSLITLEETGLVNDVLVCRYKQMIHSPTAIMPLNGSYHLLLARGDYDGQRLRRHKETPMVSEKEIDVSGPVNKLVPIISKNGCGQTKGCLVESDDCSDPDGPCRQLTYSVSEDGSWVTFEVSGSVRKVFQHYAEVSMYTVIGFSNDTRMTDTALTVCSYSNSGGGKLEFGYIGTDPLARPVLLNVSNIENYLKLIEASVVDSVVICRFKQRVLPPASPMGQVVSLLDSHYIFLSRGPYIDGRLHKHPETPIISSNKLNLTNFKDDKPTTPAPSGCGAGKGCVRSPPNCVPGSTCEYLLTYSIDESSPLFATMELSVRLLPNPSHDVPYVAVGFSKDKRMGDDAITVCYYQTKEAKGSMGLFYNPNGHTPSQPADVDVTQIVTVSEVGLINGIVTCKFKQKIDPPSNSKTVFSLNDQYYLIFARGGYVYKAQGHGALTMHDDNIPFVSSQMVNVTSAQVVDAAATRTDSAALLRKCHGILMILGWWIFIVNAIVLARYFKNVLQQQSCGTVLWFMLHRGLNTAGLLAIVAAFVCIFVAKKGIWSGDDPAAAGTHSILGMTAVVSGLFNPIMAMFRCHPGTPKRPIFNWAHRTVGLAAWCCASAAIFEVTKDPFQFDLGENGAFKKLPRYLMYAYFVTMGLVVLVMEEIHLTSGGKSIVEPLFTKPSSSPVQSQSNANHAEKETTNKYGFLKLAALVIFDVVGVSIAVIEAAFVGLSSGH